MTTPRTRQDELPQQLDERALALLATIVPGGFVPPPFRIWAQSIGLAEHVEPLGKYCREESHLSARASELAVLVAARRFRSPGAWYSHVDKAIAAGVPEECLDRLARGDDPHLTEPADDLVWRFATAVLAGDAIDDDLFDDVRATLGPDGLVDVLGCLGSFSMAAWALNVYRFGFDDPQRAWPFPDLEPA